MKRNDIVYFHEQRLLARIENISDDFLNLHVINGDYDLKIERISLPKEIDPENYNEAINWIDNQRSKKLSLRAELTEEDIRIAKIQALLKPGEQMITKPKYPNRNTPDEDIPF